MLRTHRIARPLFAIAIFASAFLIFLVQPIVGKRIVPWFGGVPAVWSVCLAFFQTALFVGYAYAHGLIRFTTPRLQGVVHAAVVAAAIVALPILPGDEWRPQFATAPIPSILRMLCATVAIPFAALAATGPLVQAWYARRFPASSPYPLYAVSNLGSLLALGAYPFLIEPHVPLSTTGRIWSIAFAIAAAAVLGCAAFAQTRAGAPAPALSEEPSAGRETPRGRGWLWVLLPACAVVLLMGVTNELCLDTASVPFLWILPLCVYLVSFIVCFASERAYQPAPYLVLCAIALIAPYAMTLLSSAAPNVSELGGSVPFQIASYCSLLFGACMILHGELYRSRPHASSLTAFYLAISAGGALGGIAVGLVAPRAFSDYHELRLGLAAAWLLLLGARGLDPSSRLLRARRSWRWAIAAITLAGVAFAAAPIFTPSPPTVLYQERNFFGVLRVHGSRVSRVLTHGTTIHGVQLAGQGTPISYFGILTGIGIAFTQGPPDSRATVGVIGLGAGTIAAYGKPGQRMRFYEIDPAVVRVARDPRYFTYLDHSAAQIEVVEGDGRISLAAERARGEPPFGFLIVDAYASDAVPIHLLTREAFTLYLDSLEPGGLLALHISSRHFALLPIVTRLAHDLGLAIVNIENPSIPTHRSGESRWVFLSRDEARIEALAREARQRFVQIGLAADMYVVTRLGAEAVASAPLWTDDYSDLLGALKSRRELEPE